MEDTITIANGRLKVDVALAKEGRISSTGKSSILYSSGGFVSTGNGVKVNITAIKPNKVS